MKARLAVLVVVLAAVTLAMVGSAGADVPPSGEHQVDHAIIQPAYDGVDGSLVYLQTTSGTPDGAASPLYVVVYPTSSAGFVGTVNCAHQPQDNCPDIGPSLADLAAQEEPAVYGNGVWGYDNILDTESDGACVPVVVVFTNSAAANQHVTTTAQLEGQLAAGDAREVAVGDPAPDCSTVSAMTYDGASAVEPVDSDAVGRGDRDTRVGWKQGGSRR
jgi:hypothetical protein